MNATTAEQIRSAANLTDLCRILRAAAPVDDAAMESLPTYGGTEPSSTSGVWSWDEKSLLVGTCASDLKVVPRGE